MPTAKPRMSDAATSIQVVKACPVEQAIQVIGGKRGSNREQGYVF